MIGKSERGKIMGDSEAPWYEYYDGVRAHLDYPDCSVFSLIENASKGREEFISYNYFGRKVTYRKFLFQIEEAARAFKSLGVQNGTRVSICMPNTPEALISFYALNKIGAISNMIHLLSAENEIKYYLNLSDSRFIIAIDLAYSKIKNVLKSTKVEKVILVSVKDSMPVPLNIGYALTKGRKVHIDRDGNWITFKQFLKMGKAYKGTTFEKGSSNEIASILYSGGTSGYPKGIELTNLNFNAVALQSFESCYVLKEKDKVLSIMPIFHGFGLGICIHTTQYFGGTSVILPQFSAKTFDKLLIKYKPNVIAGVPTLYENLLRNERLDGANLSFLSCVISGGDSLSISLKEKVDEFLKEHGSSATVREGYGLTECVTGSCLTPVNYYRKGSIGIPYPDTYYTIVTPGTINEVAAGVDGEICIAGPSVMKGYIGEEEENRKTLMTHADGKIWLHTGDLGQMDKDGFIYYKQRIKKMIISSGYNIYPQYIENVIDSMPEVLMSCVIGIDHEIKLQVAKAFIVLRKGYSQTPEMEDKIRKHCEKNLAKYSWPYEYEFRDELPKTLVGKVAYTVLEEEERRRRKDGEDKGTTGTS